MYGPTHVPMIDLELEQGRAVVQKLILHAANYLLSELEILVCAAVIYARPKGADRLLQKKDF